MGKVIISKSDASKAIPVQSVEKIVEVIKEVKVPEYITVIKEERIEVPVFHEVIREVEKIVEVPVEVIKEVEKIIEIPKIKIVEKPIYITKEVYSIEKLINERKDHSNTQKQLNLAKIALVVSIILNLILSAF